MKLNIQNSKNETVGALELNDEVFGGRVKTDLIWAAVVQENAAERRGTHATKNRALVSGGGKKPYKQKGTGRPQVGSSRTPLWRKGGTVFGPQPRSYEFDMPKKVRMRCASGGARAEAQRRRGHRRRPARAPATARRREPRRCCAGSARSGKTLVIDVEPDEAFALSARNIAGVSLVPSAGSRRATSSIPRTSSPRARRSRSCRRAWDSCQ